MPHDESFAAQLEQHPPRGLPSLHVYGTRDMLVPNARSQQLVSLWSEGLPITGVNNDDDADDGLATLSRNTRARVYEHTGGHMVPTCTGNWKQELLGFLQQVPGVLQGAPFASL